LDAVVGFYCQIPSDELPATPDCKELSLFIPASAILLAKGERSPLPLKQFVKFACSTILRQRLQSSAQRIASRRPKPSPIGAGVLSFTRAILPR
jgi:hypothetical protein